MKRKNQPWQALALAVITTSVAELFFGTTPVSRAFLLLPQLIYYGSGAILIREIARRNMFSWPSTILLAIAFALIEEGLTLQSFFNPTFVGIDLSFGRMNGINVPWVIYSTGFHAFWSICTSLMIAELIFPKTSTQPWIGKVGLWIFGILFIAACLGLHKQMQKMSGFNSPPVLYISTFCIVLVLLISSFRLSRVPHTSLPNKSNPSFWLILFSSFVVGFGWLIGLFIHYVLPSVSPAMDIAIAPILVVIGGFLLSHWSGSTHWTNEKKFAMVVGLIASDLLMGYFITRNNPVDHIGHMVIIIIVLLLLSMLLQRIKTGSSKG